MNNQPRERRRHRYNKYQSEYHTQGFIVETENIDTLENPISIYFYDTNVKGFEDTLTVSTKLPYGRAALFSSNFLYYFLRNQEEIGLTSDDPNVKIKVED